jgi:hypothetical protein
MKLLAVLPFDVLLATLGSLPDAIWPDPAEGEMDDMSV